LPQCSSIEIEKRLFNAPNNGHLWQKTVISSNYFFMTSIDNAYLIADFSSLASFFEHFKPAHFFRQNIDFKIIDNTSLMRKVIFSPNRLNKHCL